MSSPKDDVPSKNDVNFPPMGGSPKATSKKKKHTPKKNNQKDNHTNVEETTDVKLNGDSAPNNDEELEKQLAEVTEKKIQAEERAEDLSQQNKLLQQRCTEFERSLSAIDRENEQKMSKRQHELQGEKQQLSHSNEELARTNSELKHKHDSDQRVIARLNEQLQLQGTNIVQLSTERDSFETSLHETRKELAEAKKQIEKHERDFEMHVQRMSDSVQESANQTIMEMGEKHLNDIDKIQREKNAVRRENDELKEEVENLKAKNSKLETRIEVYKSKEKQILEKQVLKEAVEELVAEQAPIDPEPAHVEDPGVVYQRYGLVTNFVRGFVHKKIPTSRSNETEYNVPLTTAMFLILAFSKTC